VNTRPQNPSLTASPAAPSLPAAANDESGYRLLEDASDTDLSAATAPAASGTTGGRPPGQIGGDLIATGGPDDSDPGTNFGETFDPTLGGMEPVLVGPGAIEDTPIVVDEVEAPAIAGSFMPQSEGPISWRWNIAACLMAGVSIVAMGLTFSVMATHGAFG
jgi:hypothetical protein